MEEDREETASVADQSRQSLREKMNDMTFQNVEISLF